MGDFLYWIIVGLIAGWLAGKVMKGVGYGVLADIILGILGGILGGWVFGILGIWPGGGMIGSIIVAFVGAVMETGVSNRPASPRKCSRTPASSLQIACIARSVGSPISP